MFTALEMRGERKRERVKSLLVSSPQHPCGRHYGMIMDGGRATPKRGRGRKGVMLFACHEPLRGGKKERGERRERERERKVEKEKELSRAHRSFPEKKPPL